MGLHGTTSRTITHALAHIAGLRTASPVFAIITSACASRSPFGTGDPILKERLFGLGGPEGNHGEDVKEYYFYLDSTPTHSYMKYLYKYPQPEFPYTQLVDVNRRRSRMDHEFELIETNVFDQDRYFDIFVEYAKNASDDMLGRVTVVNRGPEVA